MTRMLLLIALTFLAVGATPALAQRRGPHSEQRREAILRRFDRDGDGRLNREERKAAREAIRRHRHDRQDSGRRPNRERGLRRGGRNGRR